MSQTNAWSSLVHFSQRQLSSKLLTLSNPPCSGRYCYTCRQVPRICLFSVFCFHSLRECHQRQTMAAHDAARLLRREPTPFRNKTRQAHSLSVSCCLLLSCLDAKTTTTTTTPRQPGTNCQQCTQYFMAYTGRNKEPRKHIKKKHKKRHHHTRETYTPYACTRQNHQPSTHFAML